MKVLKNIEWGTLLLMVGCAVLWVFAGMLWTTDFWLLSLVALPVLAAFHMSLQHEALHNHPTPWPLVNEILVSLPLAVVFPYRRYKDLHLKHHKDQNLTDPYEDPESYFWTRGDYLTMSPFTKSVFGINNTLAGRLLIGPLLTIVGFSRTELARIIKNEKGVRLSWALHAASLMVLVVLIVNVFQMPVWAYAVCVVYPSLSLASLRSFAEHQAAENVGERTAVVEAHPFWAFLYLNNNLHIVHHANPHLPWYRLPALYRERRAQYLAANGNTRFFGYSEVARLFAFRSKQPIQHPYLHKDVERPINAN